MPIIPYQTEDGSFTLYNTDVDEIYHSRRGALQESLHVFIKNGLLHMGIPHVKVVEVGFGTGFNFWLTFLAFQNKLIDLSVNQNIQTIEYIGIEPFLPDIELMKQLDFHLLGIENFHSKLELMYSQVNQTIVFDETSKMSLKIEQKNLMDCKIENADLIYYDVFGYRVAPDLWSYDALSKTYQFLNSKGILVTYCSKSIVRKTLKEIGFEVIKIPGPLGKREMVIAIKN